MSFSVEELEPVCGGPVSRLGGVEEGGGGILKDLFELKGEGLVAEWLLLDCTVD